MFYWRPPWNISIFLLQISLDRFDGSTGYYLYDARGSVSGITNEEGQVYQSYRYSVTGEITFGAPQYENEYTYNGESYNPNIESQYLRARYYCVVTATFLTEDSYLGNQTEPLTFNRYNYCVSSYLNYTDPSGNEVEVLESLKGWIIDPDTQAQKTIKNYENQRLSIEDAIESGLLNNRAGQIFLDYGDIVMGPAVKPPADIIVIRETVKGNSDSKEMQRTATAGFYAGFVGQGIEYTQIISKADYQLSMIITSAKGVNSINNPLSYLLFIKDFSLTQTIDAAKAGLQDAWNGIYDSAIGRKIGAGTFNYLLMTIGGAQLKGKGNACEAVETSYGKSTLNSLKNTENFTDSAIEHIFEGQVNARGKAVGYHYEGIEGTFGNVIPGTESSTNNFGIYKAKVEVNGIPKTANGGFSTFYSKNLSPQQVVDAINEAYSNCELKLGTRNTYQGVANNGMKIDMFLDQSGKIISAFPEE